MDLRKIGNYSQSVMECRSGHLPDSSEMHFELSSSLEVYM